MVNAGYCLSRPVIRLLPGGGGVLLFLLLVSCATRPDVYKPVDQHVAEGNYIQAAAAIAEAQDSRKPVYPEKNAVMLFLDKGMLDHYAGNYAKSAGGLEEAERLIADAYTKSVMLEIGTFILNDNTREYAGEDYEDVYLNVFNALNYYNRGNVEEALVEVRKINGKLQALAVKYAKSIENAKRYADENGGYSGDNDDNDNEKYTFDDSALARYLAALFWRGTGRADDARIDLDALAEVYRVSPHVYDNPVPSTVKDEYRVPPGEARLNFIAFTGLSPLKEEEITYIPLPFAFPHNTAKIALPVIRDRPVRAVHVEAVIDGNERLVLELVEDMGKVMEETFKARRSLIYVKTVVRTIVKASVAAGFHAMVADEDESGWGGLLAGIVGRLFVEGTEAADTRSARYFPRYAFVGGINLPPGEHAVTLNFYAGGSIVMTMQKTVQARENELNLVEAVCLK
ncbi:MAG: hypothetical protein LBL31_01140 [Spirochaetaceae bacterium]|nr:hypothetical protein [Spirochaetaceae bacterium]